MKHIYDINASNFANNASILHDMICINWGFNYNDKTLVLALDKELQEGKRIKVIFNNVFAHKMISCDFWGPSPHIFSWSLVDEKDCFLRQQIEKEIRTNEYVLSRFDSETHYMEIEIVFTSGDVLRILCQSISIEE